jgi:hypothetical protein
MVEPYDGANKYLLLPEGMPPVKGFWYITMTHSLPMLAVCLPFERCKSRSKMLLKSARPKNG